MDCGETTLRHSGVAEVNSFGGLLKQYEVAVNPNRLKGMNVTIAEIFSALEKNNENTGGAYIDKKPNARRWSFLFRHSALTLPESTALECRPMFVCIDWRTLIEDVFAAADT